MKKYFILIALLSIVACDNKPKQNNTISVTIKGLKKGTVYLQKFQDTTYSTIDSLSVKGEQSFQLGCQLDEPEVLYLSLSKSIDADRVQFFADTGITSIHTTLKRFVYDAKIEGSTQQKILKQYRDNLERFKIKQLELLEVSLNAQRLGKEKEASSAKKEMKANLKRQYLYSINYAINNKDNEVAPYIALSDVYDVNSTFLDTIYKSLTPRIATSKYGVILKDYLGKIKSEDN